MILFSIFFLISLYFFVRMYYKYIYIFNKRLKKFPCPPEVPILGHVLDFAADASGTLDILMSYINKYGDTVHVKIGATRHLLITADYSLFHFILTSTRILKKSIDYRYFQPWLGTGLITSDGEKWKTHRRIITPTFHFQILEDFVDIFDSNTRILIKKFEECLDTTSVDIYDFVNLCTLDIICESAMGTSVNAQGNTQSEYVQSVKAMLDIIIARVFTPYKAIDWLYVFTQDYKKQKKALECIHAYTWSVIKSRQDALSLEETEGKGKNKKAFLDRLLELNSNGEKLSLEEIREEVDSFMFAGHDTTATALSFIMFCLANHPEEQNKVFSEQKQIFGEDFQRAASLEDLKNMRYLELVIKESLRLYPPAPFISRELEHDILYEGTVLPKGLTITLFTFALHRNPNYFEDPEKFLPSRFEADNGKLPFAFLPFSAGSRNCIGQRFAMAEMKSVASRILRSFELLPAVPAHELKLASQTILISNSGVRIGLKRRA